MPKMTDAQRHSSKVTQFADAVERVGLEKVLATIGASAVNGFNCAADAQARRKDSDMIGWFISYAQDCADEFCNLQLDEDVYAVLNSLRTCAPVAMPDFHSMQRPELSAWYIQNVGYDIGADDPPMSLDDYRAHCVEYFNEARASS